MLLPMTKDDDGSGRTTESSISSISLSQRPPLLKGRLHASLARAYMLRETAKQAWGERIWSNCKLAAREYQESVAIFREMGVGTLPIAIAATGQARGTSGKEAFAPVFFSPCQHVGSFLRRWVR